jgi:hypothetical protein
MQKSPTNRLGFFTGNITHSNSGDDSSDGGNGDDNDDATQGEPQLVRSLA